MDTAAITAALRYLGPRARLESEVRDHLIGKGFARESVEEVVQFLRERKLLNDKTTTQSLIERRSGKRSVGIETLRAELEKLGAPEDTIESSLAGLDESARAVEALGAKFQVGVERAKAGRFLYGRGFSDEAVEAALDAFCGSFPE